MQLLIGQVAILQVSAKQDDIAWLGYLHGLTYSMGIGQIKGVWLYIGLYYFHLLPRSPIALAWALFQLSIYSGVTALGWLVLALYVKFCQQCVYVCACVPVHTRVLVVPSSQILYSSRQNPFVLFICLAITWLHDCMHLAHYCEYWPMHEGIIVLSSSPLSSHVKEENDRWRMWLPL